SRIADQACNDGNVRSIFHCLVITEQCSDCQRSKRNRARDETWLMRLVAWNCNMAMHRKVDALLSLRADVAVSSECAAPERLREKSKNDWIEDEPVRMGRSRDKGLGVFAFNGYRLEAPPAIVPTLRRSGQRVSCLGERNARPGDAADAVL